MPDLGSDVFFEIQNMRTYSPVQVAHICSGVLQQELSCSTQTPESQPFLEAQGHEQFALGFSTTPESSHSAMISLDSPQLGESSPHPTCASSQEMEYVPLYEFLDSLGSHTSSTTPPEQPCPDPGVFHESNKPVFFSKTKLAYNSKENKK